MHATTVLYILTCASSLCAAQYAEVYRRIRNCVTSGYPMICLKEEALILLNETIVSDKPVTIYDMIDVVKDPNYHSNTTEEPLPKDASLRSEKLTQMLEEKMDELIHSRTVKLNLNSVIQEGRKKKSKGAMMIMIGSLLLAGMLMKLYLGKIAFLAGAAFIKAKLALLLTAAMIMKKIQSSGGSSSGGETQHVVYTSSQSDYGHSHGGGGGYGRSWEKRFDDSEEGSGAAMYYAQNEEDSNYNNIS